MAFPDTDIAWMTAAPVNTTLCAFEDRIEIHPLEPQPSKVADVIPWASARERVLELLSKGKGQHFGKLKRSTSSLWPAAVLPQDDMMIYEILRELAKDGLIRFEESSVGDPNGATIPKTFTYLESEGMS
jgi:hypothetical protein